MSGSISISPQKAPSATIGFATGGAPGNITLATGGAPGNITVPGRSTPVATTSAPAPAPTQVYQTAAPAAPPQVYAPALDTNALYSKAGATAEANVNPYYTKLLNDFIAQQGTAKAQQQQQTDMNVQAFKDQLARIQSANTVSGTRAGEDAATAEAQAATATDNRQIDQGTAFNATRTAEAEKLAQSGLTGSGLGSHQQATTQEIQDTTEGRQAAADQNTKDATELVKARTFEDLATSNKNAVDTENKSEVQAKFDLDKFITGQTQDLAAEQQSVEQQRRQNLASETATQTKILLNNFINSIANPAQRQAALQAYGGLA